MFAKRSEKLERIDTGDYTDEEFERFLREIAFINRYFGDRQVLKRTLFQDIERKNLTEFSVLDVGAGSGEMLRVIAEFAKKTGRKAFLTGLDLNRISAETVLKESKGFAAIESIQSDALNMPFVNASFDYVISSLFTHHLSDQQVVCVISEMDRARRGLYIIDLHRHPLAYAAYKIFCSVFRISPLVRHDGSLSILRAFRRKELEVLAQNTVCSGYRVERYFPFRLVLRK